MQFQYGMPASAAPASSFNDSMLVPLIPVSWADQMAKAEALVGKGSDLWTKAQLMAQLTSLTYCGFDAVTAWNCSRWALHAHSVRTTQKSPWLTAWRHCQCPWLRGTAVHWERWNGGGLQSQLTACHARFSVLPAACRAGATCSGQSVSLSSLC